ncbi:hypothetical protein EXIGLDRAFT_773602 [Exidia glandulosa HHB12029]|uniref:Beta-lactamase-related domain-containing protein n=1 Tax=Exidia glandulosa HHB12029 TaxID=1314781 RepID=A0A165EQ55_EXIGL|nr:hypothetical protein EXIGLDRAFT_774574 [Exidia glandulosa HHB12029]KZV87454.1 hypothetical protein EXIGLDRAFT_773602 [Exidia glandulosa HHB12029]
MWQDQAEIVPEWKDAIRNRGIDCNFLYTGVPGSGRGWGISFQLNLKQLSTGRNAGSGTWAGAANLYYAVDPVSGIATALFTQSVPVFDPVVCKVFGELEAAVYSGVKAT